MSKRSTSRTAKSRQSSRSVQGKSRTLDGGGASGREVSSKKVSPTSERIIKETSVKWRKTMQVLANR